MGNLKVISIWEQYSYYYLEGMSATLKIALVSVLTSILFGIIIGILRLSRNWALKNIVAFYVSFIRGTPMLIHIPEETGAIYLLYRGDCVQAGLYHERTAHYACGAADENGLWKISGRGSQWTLRERKSGYCLCCVRCLP